MVQGDATHSRGTDERRRRGEEQPHPLINFVSDIITVLEADGTIRFESPSVERVLGYRPEESAGKHAFDNIHLEDLERVMDAFAEVLAESGSTRRVELRIRHADGSWHHFESIGSNMLDNPSVGGIVVASRDITERKRTEQALRESEQRFRQLFDQSVDALFVHDEKGRFVDCNSQACRLLGYSREELLELSVQDISLDVLTEEERTSKQRDGGTLWQRALAGEPGMFALSHEEENVRKDGSTFPAEVRVGSVEYGGRRMILASVRDITERRQTEVALRESEERLAYRAFHDPLTGLANRSLFLNRLEHAQARAKRQTARLAVLFMDLDDFKVINDSLGHRTGDQLLVAVADRLRTCVRPQDTVARLGGDEFVALLEDLAGAGGAARVAERIMEELRVPFSVGDQRLHTSASIGIALNGASGGDLLRAADTAMYRAKEMGKGRYVMFEEAMHDRALKRLRLENDLRAALDRGELAVRYQPKVELRTGKVAGVEALLRWQHAERGLLAPPDFMPLAEETGLIVPIGRWVLSETCRQARVWQELRPRGAPLMACVNLSVKQLQQIDFVAEVLEETGLDPGSLVLEITEDIVMEDTRAIIGVLEELKRSGVRFALDDFGTGQSSLSYLRRLPVDYLKIDRSFIERLGEDPKDTEIVSGTIVLVHALGLKAVAEGVETPEQFQRLLELGCDLAQGNHFSKPLTAADLRRYLEEN